MPWLDLQEDILEEFASRQSYSITIETPGLRIHSPKRNDAEKWAIEYAGVKRQRAEQRAARAADRPPCPQCGGKVERVGKTAKIPTYCTPKCTRAARFARWYAKHGQERNAARRKSS